MKIGVVIPAYKVAKQIGEVIRSLPSMIKHIIVIDDSCPDFSGKEVEKIKDKRIEILYHERNGGVGAAMITGYKKAMELGCDIVIKIDGDGQMDPAYINKLIAPLLKDEADYTKGNRFANASILKSMPKIRFIGNSMLSFLVKMASGYWNIMDPTNGYTAIHKRVLGKLNFNRLSKRYFFESDMLINLNIINVVVKDIVMPARYGSEESALKIANIIPHFIIKLAKGFVRRIFFKYFLYDFNMASVYIIIGLPMFIGSFFLGIVEWIDSMTTGIPKSAGTIMLIALPIIISFQMLLQAINIDIMSTPKRRSKLD